MRHNMKLKKLYLVGMLNNPRSDHFVNLQIETDELLVVINNLDNQQASGIFEKANYPVIISSKSALLAKRCPAEQC